MLYGWESWWTAPFTFSIPYLEAYLMLTIETCDQQQALPWCGVEFLLSRRTLDCSFCTLLRCLVYYTTHCAHSRSLQSIEISTSYFHRLASMFRLQQSQCCDILFGWDGNFHDGQIIINILGRVVSKFLLFAQYESFPTDGWQLSRGYGLYWIWGSMLCFFVSGRGRDMQAKVANHLVIQVHDGNVTLWSISWVA